MSDILESNKGCRNHIYAGTLIAFLMIVIRIAIAFRVGWIMLIPLFGTMIFVTRLSPPATGLTLLYGWVLFGQMDFAGFWLIPRIPTISTLTIWTLLWLFHWRRIDGSLKYLDRSVIINHSLLLLLFFAVGFLGALNSGYLSNPLVRFYNWDIFRGWVGYLAIAMLGCRNLNDLKVIFVGLPLAFLIYPLSLPLQAWQDLFGSSLFSSEVFNIGLSYASLNTNTLGQAAAVASVVAVATCWNLRRSGLRTWMFFLFVVASAIVFMTSARQALIGWLTGLFAIGVVSGSKRSLMWLVVMGLFIYVGAQTVIRVLPPGSGFQTRLIELTQPPETWASQSFTLRQRDIGETIERWLESPLFGVGFGGQRFEEIPSTNIPELEDPGAFNFALSGTHNLFLGVLAQTGLVGLILFLTFCLSSLRRFLRILHHVPEFYSDDVRLARGAILAALACIFVMQNISGGMGIASSSLFFILGSMLGILGAAQAGAMTASN